MSAAAAASSPDSHRPASIVPWAWRVRDYLEADRRVDLSLGATALYQHLAAGADRYGESFRSVSRIGRAIRVKGRPASDATVRRWRAELVDVGLLVVDYGGGRNRTNLYRLLYEPTRAAVSTGRARRAADARARRTEKPARQATNPRDVARVSGEKTRATRFPKPARRRASKRTSEEEGKRETERPDPAALEAERLARLARGIELREAARRATLAAP